MKKTIFLGITALLISLGWPTLARSDTPKDNATQTLDSQRLSKMVIAQTTTSPNSPSTPTVPVKTNIVVTDEAPAQKEPDQPVHASPSQRINTRSQSVTQSPATNPKQKPTISPSQQPMSQKDGLFVITNEDETVFLALRRWAEDVGYQLVWDAGKDFPAKRTAYSANNIEDAIDLVMRDTARSSYPLHACAYNNKVIRVLHVSQSCERANP